MPWIIPNHADSRRYEIFDTTVGATIGVRGISSLRHEESQQPNLFSAALAHSAAVAEAVRKPALITRFETALARLSRPTVPARSSRSTSKR